MDGVGINSTSLNANLLNLSAVVVFSVLAALVHAEHGHHNHPHPARSSTVFPFLTWLRDSAVKVVFGGPTKTPSTVPKLARKYHNEIVIRFNLTEPAEEQALKEAADRLFLDIWAFTRDFVDVRVHKDYVSSLLGLLPSSLGHPDAHSILIHDLSSAVYATYPSQPARQTQVERNMVDLSAIRTADGVDNVFFQDYQPTPVVVRWMRLLEAMFPSFVEYVDIGTSYEGREIPALRVGQVIDDDQAAKNGKNRKTLVVTGGLHAREWISTTTVNYLAWSFITSYGKEPMITKLLQAFDIVFIPALNPDGIEYTWSVDRLWRKSRQHTNLHFCRGLDLDHAFGYEWDGTKHQNDPCSESYGGDRPFQATEASELAEWARNETENNNVNIVGLIDLHSYSQQVMFPFSYSCEVDPPNLENLMELATGIAKAIRLSSGESYSVASACEGAVVQGSDDVKPGVRIEAGGGSAIDWFYHELKAHYSYQIKLRDTGGFGFLLPRESIVPTGEEMFNAMKYLGDFLLGNNGIERLATSQPEQRPLQEDEETAWADSEDTWELRRRRRRV